jgi:DNA-binding NtrC family response regulator
MNQALATLGYTVSAAVNGEDALQQLAERPFDLILLDLKMPGMDGMEVLRRVMELRPDIRVIIVTAHGAIESAVEAMKLGAVDFIQKPFTPQEIQELVADVLDSERIKATETWDYQTHLKLAKQCVADRHLEAAQEHARQAIAINPSRPEAFNLLGALHDMRRQHSQAMKNYRVALDLDPTYKPAQENLFWSGDRRGPGSKPNLG